MPDEYVRFIDEINNKSIPTRYPDDLKKILAAYKKKETKIILHKTEELIKWLKEKLEN